MKTIIIILLGLISTVSALMVKQELERLFYKGKVKLLFHSLNIYFVSMLLCMLVIILFGQYRNMSSFAVYIKEFALIGAIYIPFYAALAYGFKRYMASLKKYEVKGNVLVIKPKYLAKRQH